MGSAIQYEIGDLVFCAEDLFNDGGFPGAEAEALIVPAGPAAWWSISATPKPMNARKSIWCASRMPREHWVIPSAFCRRN